MANKRDGTPTPLASNEPPDLPPITFDIDDVTGHYPIGLLQKKAHEGRHSENPLEHPELFDPTEADDGEEPAVVAEGGGLRLPDMGELNPAVLLVGSLLIGGVLAVVAVVTVVLAMAALGV